jgi:hypothetical protein
MSKFIQNQYLFHLLMENFLSIKFVIQIFTFLIVFTHLHLLFFINYFKSHQLIFKIMLLVK